MTSRTKDWKRVRDSAVGRLSTGARGRRPKRRQRSSISGTALKRSCTLGSVGPRRDRRVFIKGVMSLWKSVMLIDEQVSQQMQTERG